MINYHRMKIRSRYLESIRNGRKKHEYRLATPDRKKIEIGDILILISNDNPSDYVKVIVKSFEFYKNWEEPLNKYWEDDFSVGANTLEEAKNECYKFYKRDLVKTYGIEVFEIELFNPKIMKANVLLDTNIVIHRESSNNVAYEVIQLYKSLDKLSAHKLIIEDIKNEIKKHRDKSVVHNMLAKLEAYDCVNSKEISDDLFKKVVSKYSQNENSIIDNKFLYQIYKGLADFLITDDRGILTKAKDLYIEDIVLSTSDFLNLIERKYPKLIRYEALSVDLCKISSLNINDPFFNTLREDYKGIEFNNWLEGKAKNGESGYVFKNKNGLQGFLYLKIEEKDENYSDIKPKFFPKRRVKVGTFKINSTGLRVGERFIKIIFDYANKCDVDEVYVTLFENKRPEVGALQKLMEDWGFEKHGIKLSTGEAVMVKKMKIYRNDKDPKFNYPIIKQHPRYGILPIDSQFHTELFPDLFLKNENMTLFEEKPCGYAVEKIYVCSTKHIKLNPGDIMAIYRMSDRFYKKYSSVISGICILQSITYATDYNNYLEVCKNRSVFSPDQLNYFYHEKNFKTILKVLFLKPLENKIILNDLIQNDIISEEVGPRITATISEANFDKLLKMGGIDEL